MSIGVWRLLVKLPKNQRIPSLLSKDRTELSGTTALISHETNITSTCEANSSNMMIPNVLFFIWVQIVYVNNTKL